MNRVLLTLVTTLACSVTSHAQVHLKTGDVFVYQFTTLRFTFSGGGPYFGRFWISGTLQQSSELRYEMFENNLADPVFCSGTFSEPRTNDVLAGREKGEAWQDLQGTIRLTMLQGTADINSLNFLALLGGLLYEAKVDFPPVPTYTLAISNNGLGSVRPPGGISGGDPAITLTATPSNDWQFLNWTGDATGSANPLQVTMTTNKFIIANFVQRPTILFQPQSPIAAIGDIATFSVAARGAQPLIYQWQFKGAPLGMATNETLTLTNVQLSQQGGYSVVVTNRYGIATSEVAILTLGANAVTVCDEPALREAISRGRKVTFACDGTITLSNTITISADTALDGTGRSVTISGNNAVRLFNVNTGVTFTVMNLTLANGRHQARMEPPA